MQIVLFILIAWLVIDYNAEVKRPQNEQSYRAAKYSIIVDFSRIQDMVPGLPSWQKSYNYYIEYGADKHWEIIDPGTETAYLPRMITEWDHLTGASTLTLIRDDIMKYYVTVDTPDFQIDKSKWFIENLCTPDNTILFCDSVKATAYLDSFETVIYLQDSILNIPAFHMFYPDIKYLPIKIIPKTKKHGIRILEEVVYGKKAVDELLRLHSPVGYELIPKDEMELYIDQINMDELRRMVPEKKD